MTQTLTRLPAAQVVPSDGSREKRTRRRRRTGLYVLVYGSALLFVIFSVFPILWGLSTALKPTQDQYEFPPQWFPTHLTLDHFVTVFSNQAIIHAFLNTLVISIATTIIALVVGILGAYGFSRYRFPGRRTLLVSVLFTQLFPRVVVIVPFFITLRNLNLINTLPGLVLVYLMVVFPISIWMIKGFFDRIPREIEEAAIVDGCSIPRLLWRIVLPISRPALVAVAMYSFILSFNEFLFALVFTSGAQSQPLSVALAFFIDDTGIHWGDLMAASLLMSVPAIVVFSFAQKLLVRGLSEGAVKG
jgi:ABC-type glycerol-3-phosphate transport system permease component